MSHHENSVRFANAVKQRHEQEQERIHRASRAGKIVPLHEEPKHIRDRIHDRATANLDDEGREQWKRLIAQGDAPDAS